ncbi:hypothetical protein GM418_00785 [Maribellus comscasis]|uniref:YdhG-like domain-containing protein n=1 Tax=Maribellus comscasis TaxID=2681766 RepID=A0A6I6JMP2_9BACT|nr:DUF1801 domain-containing protein [Maribellus comscasis]QGY42240.1 hypothetical protein GM418_00785 [Maribellus comscasis]
MKNKSESVDDYISEFPEDIQKILKKLRKTILEIAPEAEESISYGMPAYKTSGKPLVYFAGYKKHVRFLCNSKRTCKICPGTFAVQTRKRFGAVSFKSANTI